MPADRNNGYSVIESDDYREEESILMKDPIVIKMAVELYKTADSFEISEAGMSSHQFVSVANDEYKRRGGTQNRSIGGVARAIRILVNEMRNNLP